MDLIKEAQCILDLKRLSATESLLTRKLDIVSVFYAYQVFWFSSSNLFLCRHLKTNSFRWFNTLLPMYSIMERFSCKRRQQAPFLLVGGHFFKVLNLISGLALRSLSLQYLLDSSVTF